MTVENVKNDLLSALPRFYSDSIEVDGIMQANAIEIDRIRENARTLLNQFTVGTATFGLSDWERVLALPRRPNATNEMRRARIISRLLGSKPATLANMLAIVNAHTTTNDSKIVELPEPGTILFQINSEGIIDLNAMLEDIETYIPAHLAFKISTALKANYYLGTTIQSGVSVTVYPYITQSIEQRGYASHATATINAQTTTVYPRGEQ